MQKGNDCCEIKKYLQICSFRCKQSTYTNTVYFIIVLIAVLLATTQFRLSAAGAIEECIIDNENISTFLVSKILDFKRLELECEKYNSRKEY